ncbi:MAG: leucyl aminopeptidase [Spirochaetes bacterium]|nr:leucyl aminopeptidase [Spirochaetota bacterium]
MKLSVVPALAALKPKDTAAVFFTEKDIRKGSVLLGPLRDEGGLLDLGFLKGKPGEVHFFPMTGRPNLLIACLGPEDRITDEILRNTAGAVIDLCRGRAVRSVYLQVPAIQGIEGGRTLRAVAEGIVLSNYSFSRYKQRTREDAEPLVDRCTLCSAHPGGSALVRRVQVVSENTLLCRDLINEISEKTNSVMIAGEAKKIAQIPGITCRVLGKKEIQSLKMGLLLAVNRGSSVPPQLIVMSYRGNPGSKKSIALVGKGITFDSGGINLKPSGHIETMRSDMSGAAAVLYAVKSAAELKLKINVHAVVPLTDNMLSNSSYRPGDIFTSFSGKTVEIGNTDAEGRLILADAVAYAEKSLKPQCIVDMATLTGACIVALGECVAAYLTDDRELAGLLEESSSATGEKLWRMPLVKEYEENMKSDFADICNISSEKNAGTIMGAIFIKNFVEKTRWAHIDIAGTSWYSKKRGYVPKYATGYGVRLLVELLTRWK